MMLVVAPTEDKRETKMASDNEDDNLQVPPTTGEENGAASSRKQKGSSEGRLSKKSSSSSNKEKTKATSSRSRSTTENGDKKSRSGSSSNQRNSSSSSVPPCDDEGSVMSSRSARKKSSKSSTAPKASISRRARPAGDIKSDREAVRKMRRRPSTGMTAVPVNASKKDDDDQNSADKYMDSSASTRKHRSKSRTRVSDGGMDRSGRSTRSARSTRSTKSTRSSRSEKGGRSLSGRESAKQESTLDSVKPLPDDDSPPPSPTAPILSLRSSVKVASALVKFRKVLAMSKEASATAQKYSDEQKHKAEEESAGKTAQKQEENKKDQEDGKKATMKADASRQNSKHSRSSQHRRSEDRGENNSKHRSSASRHRKSGEGGTEGSKHKKNGDILRSSQHRKSEDGTDNHSTRSKRPSKGQNDSGHGSSKQPSSSSINQDPELRDAEAFLKEAFSVQALSNVGKKRQSSPSKTDKPATKDKPSPPKETAAPKDTSNENRHKSSAKVSTAMLKFQQALALSKSATQAARSQQDTQNKLLGEVHGEKKTPEDYLSRFSSHRTPAGAVLASPVSTVEVEPLKADDSPKVPNDLDGDSDIDSEISIDDVEDDLTVSDVATDSEEETSVVMDDDMDGKAEKSKTTAPVSIVSCNTDSDFDMASDVEDHSDVDIDTDDDLDSDEEKDSAAGDDISLSSNDNSDSKENKSSRSDSKMDFDCGEDDSVRSERKDTAEVSIPGAEQKQPISHDAEKQNSRARSSSSDSSPKSSQSELNKEALNSISKDNQHMGAALRHRNGKDCEEDEVDDDASTYLPMSIARPKKDDLQNENHDHGLEQETRRSSSSSSSHKSSRHEMKRRPSNRSLKKSKSNVESSAAAQVPLDTARKLLGDHSLGRRSRGSSRIRKPPGKSSSAGSEEDDSQRERRSKPSSSSDAEGKDRKRGSERSRRSSSVFRNRTLAGISNLSQKEETPKSQGEEDGRKPSLRRRTPSRAKSHDPALPVRRSSRASSKSRRSAAPPLDVT